MLVVVILLGQSVFDFLIRLGPPPSLSREAGTEPQYWL